MTGVQTRQVTAADEGMRLDRWFKQHFPQLGHGRLQKLLRTGQVRVDGGRVKANARLNKGQTIRIPPLAEATNHEIAGRRDKPALSEADITFIRGLVLHKDPEVIVLNKPSGLPVQGGTKAERNLDAMLDGITFEAQERPRLVHRLDKDTSGVLVLARSRTAASKLGQALKSRQARKIYWALVKGVPRVPQGRIDLPLIKTGRSGEERVRVAEDAQYRYGAREAQAARSYYALLEHAGQDLAWLAMMPVTGRTHQLRVHAAAIGHPIIGDGKYGGAQAHPGGGLTEKLHLHARSIDIPHPGGGSLLLVSAPLPKHMLKAWAMLGFDPDYRDDPFAET